jgi:hypothetical protein
LGPYFISQSYLVFEHGLTFLRMPLFEDLLDDDDEEDFNLGEDDEDIQDLNIMG